MNKRLYLNSGWTLDFTHPDTGKRHCFSATVPGNMEIDLLREGLIEQIFPPDDPDAMRKWDWVDDWTYATEFAAPAPAAGERVELVFAGIDTIAEISLNGERLMHCNNMFIPHAVDVATRLKSTENRLQVRIFSPERYAEKFNYDACVGTLPHHESCSYLRKARHMWGWDNAPRLLSAGLWRQIYLQYLPPVHFDEVYLYTQKIQGDSATVGLSWKMLVPSDYQFASCFVKIMFQLDGQIVCEQSFPLRQAIGRLNRELIIEEPRLWWPRGYGEATLYEVKLQLRQGNRIISDWNTKFGLRELTLERVATTDEQGHGEFVFRCNGEKIYCRGSNWKPLSPLHSLSGEKLRRALELYLDCNCNMIRVWGGGVYEDHDFFNFCDEHGLLVWQDFMLACEFPPQDLHYQQKMSKEAEVIIKQLRNHPSLALWCGDNETDMSFFWGTFLPTHLKPSDNLITRETLRRAVLRFDPGRPYLESSPYISDEIASDRSTDLRMLRMAPEQHVYQGNNDDFRTAYRSSAAHFISETGPGLGAMAESPTIQERELARIKRLWNSPSSLSLDSRHQADEYFLIWKNQLQKRLKTFFDQDFFPDNMSELTLAANIMAGDAYKFAVEYSRIRKWRQTGVLWWSMLDMWPMIFNISVVDACFRPKKPYYWLRQAQLSQCLIAAESDLDRFDLFAVNDTRREFRGTMRRYRVDTEGNEKTCKERDFCILPNTAAAIEMAIDRDANRGLNIIVWEVGGKQHYNHFVAGFPPFSFAAYAAWSAYLDRLYQVPSAL